MLARQYWADGAPTGTRRRPQRPLTRSSVGDAIMNIIGVDIGGTKCAVIRADRHGIPRDVRQFPTTGVRETLKKLQPKLRLNRKPRQ